MSVDVSIPGLSSDTVRLIELVQQLSFARTLDDVTGIVTSVIREAIGADGATFVLRDGDKCHYVDERAIGPLWKGKRFPLETCISGWAMLNRQPAVIENIFNDPRIPLDAYRPTFVRSLAMVPVRVEEPLGAIGAYWADHKHVTHEQLAALQTIAHTAALALQNVDLLSSVNRASEAKSRLLAAVSHDLRQPLQSIALFAAATENMDMASPARRAIENISGSVERMGDLLDAILDVSRFAAGIVPSQPRTARLGEVLAPLIEEMRPQAEAKGLRLRHVPTAAAVVTDPVLLGNALRNLIANAIRYTDKGGIVVGARRQKGNVALWVTDSGSGIADENLDLIFEEFYQVGNQERDRTLGLGLGLSVVRRTCDMLGHKINVRSSLGRGSSFVIALGPEV